MAISYFLFLSCVGFFSAQAQDCSRPVPGDNMDLKGSDILLGSFPDGIRVKFECNSGYSPTGGSISITCTEGIWSPLTLTCERKSCGSAGEVLNGDIRYPSGAEFGGEAVLVCNIGYRLVGRDRLRCGNSGWEGRLGQCEVVTCDPPQAIANGTHHPEKDVYKYKEVVEYTCNRGLDLIGSATISCGNNGQFDFSPPECKDVECLHFEIPNGISIDGSRPPHKYKQSMTFQCNEGYKFRSHSTVVCGSDSRWNREHPVCDVVTCPPPSQVDRGSFSPSQNIYQYNDEVRYSCDTGYKVTGTNVLLCSQSGTFTPASPTCTRVTCGRPSKMNHGSFSPDKMAYQYNEEVKYSCDTGYTMSGSDTRSCSQSGTFAPASPTCTIMTCGRPTKVDHGSFSPDKMTYQYNEEVKYSCDAGYKMSGSDSRSCSQSGTFTSASPTCTRIPNGNGLDTTTTTENDCVGLKAAIGVLVGIIIILLVICWYLYKRQKKHSSVKHHLDDNEAGVFLSERKNDGGADGVGCKATS